MLHPPRLGDEDRVLADVRRQVADPLAPGTYTYKVCKLNTTNCSNRVTITY